MTFFVVIAVLLFFVVIGAVVIAVTRKENVALRRLKELQEAQAGGSESGMSRSYEDEQLDKPFYERIIQPVLDKFGRKLTKKEGEDKIAELIMMAGNPGNLTSGQFKAVQLLLGFGLVIFVLLLALFGLVDLVLALALGGGAFLAAYVLPTFWLKSKVSKRQKAIRRTLPDVLDLLTVSVEAGLGFDQALQKVVERSKGALAEELNRTLQEIKLGSTRRDALKNLTTRTQVEELSTLVSAILQADTLGVSIGGILRIQSDQMRVTRRQQLEEAAQKMPIKMLFPMVLFIFPTIFIVVLGPIALRVGGELKKMGFV